MASGTVQAEDGPVSGVLITLEPIAPTTGPKASVPVFAGNFEFGSGLGLHGGKYRVRFSLMPIEIRKTIPIEHAVGLPAADAVMRSQYDERSQLTWDLSIDQSNQQNFKIEIR